MANHITKTTLTTSQWLSYKDTHLLSPYNIEFYENVIEPLYQRAKVGADTYRLADDLYSALHPWLTRFIARKSRNLPPTADLGELESRVHEAALLACRSLDWNRTETFTGLLRVRVEGAVIEAARYDDWLSRRHRRMLNEYRSEVEDREQRLGRVLSESEKRDIARQLSPETARRDWESDLQRQFAPTTWNDTFENQLYDSTYCPEENCLNDEYIAIVHQWLTSLPEGIGQIAYDWAMDHVDGKRNAPRPIMRKMKKYIPTLIEMLGPHMREMGLSVEI